MEDIVGRPLRALIVEDSEDDAMLLLHALRDGGFTPDYEIVDTPQALLANLRAGGWDVVFCDHEMPCLDAPHALEIVRNHDRDLPFIIVSGVMSEDWARRRQCLGASRSLGADGENRPRRGRFSSISPGNGRTISQESGEKWAGEVGLQPETPKSDGLPGEADCIDKSRLDRLVPVLNRQLGDAEIRRELIRVRDALERSRNHDEQSGLANIEGLRKAMARMIRRGQPFLIARVELVGLRRILKTVGLEGSPGIWAKLGKRISILHENELSARIGEDHFILLIEGGEDVSGDAVASGMLREMALPIRAAGHVLYFPCHVGISRYPDNGEDTDALIERAGIALHSARESARDHVVYARDLDMEWEDRIGMARALHRALHQHEFVLHYQPQYDLASGRLVGVEALLRWDRPGHGLVPPSRFIPILEETRLIVPVGEWVLKTACETMCRWQGAGYTGIRMAVNLSAVQFRQGGLPEMVDRVLRQTGLEPGLLELEITESIAMFNEREVMGTLSALKALGVLLAIDDFGTGYSSLGYIKHFPVDKLKIDRTFIKDIIRDHGDVAIVRAILAMAASLRFDVIAEGVESAEQAALLRGYGCQGAQGFHFGRPVPETRLLDTLRAEGRRADTGMHKGGGLDEATARAMSALADAV